MRKRLAIVISILFVVGGGLGGFLWKQAKDDERKRAATAAAKAEALEEQRQQELDEYELELAAFEQDLADYKDYKTCKVELTPLLTSIQNLNSRLNVGLILEHYGQAVGAISIRYDRIREGRLTDECIDKVKEPGRKAYNAYWRANKQWGDCLRDFFNRDVDEDIIDNLRAKWKTAGHFQSKPVQDGKGLTFAASGESWIEATPSGVIMRMLPPACSRFGAILGMRARSGT